MKMLVAKAKTSGFTLIELFVVLAMLAVLYVLLYSAKVGGGSNFARCGSHLKQIGIGYMMWADDHDGKFPAQISITNNGAMELDSSGYASLQFRSLSKYLRNNLDVFVCPADKTRHVVTNFNDLRDENVSYFINVDATADNPSHTILAGDRNLSADGQVVKPGFFELTTNLDMSWTREMHWRGGNLLFADGHVQLVVTNELNSLVRNQPLATNRLCVP
jgi:prepilin-type N-terminal cleavage/methylation domain-containing protein/prepilin-type processing-associated H-X9-DG protein